MLIPMKKVLAECSVPITGVIHAGAHLGEEASFYAEANLPVLWIEGNPDLILQLERNVTQYGHRVVNALVGAEPGMTMFNIANNGQSSSVLELGTHLQKHPEVHYVAAHVLPVRTLDDIATTHGAMGYNFLNLDLQGYELEALKGATEVLYHVEYIYTEINVDELYVGCARLADLDRYLVDFERVTTVMAGNTGWGDGFYRRRHD